MHNKPIIYGYQKKWNIETHVIQSLGSHGQWYDYSTWNVNPLETPHPDMQEYVKASLPDDEPWRVIRRLATEEIVNYNDPA